jgi:2-oxoglutarate ferredoxin oxidoreductase subunit beta
MSAPITDVPEYTKKDFVSDQTVRWCPGCGDYAILNAVQQTFAKMGVPREKCVVISGIGCSSRFPYYMNTYGFHTIHGRAPGFATGLKVARPDLSVWVVTGDGDALSIGGNHLLHALRRNVDIKVLLFNNRIYGLTKGQYSPTSEVGKKTKSSPFGSPDRPIQPVSFALAAEATFVARTVDTYGKEMQDVLMRAAEHKGSAFVEILQNCLIFNDGTFDDVRLKQTRADQTVKLIQGEPLIFGKDRDKGIRWHGDGPEVVSLGPGGVSEDEVLRHDETAPDPTRAYMLSQLQGPDFPVPMGVFRALQEKTYDQTVHEQLHQAREQLGKPDLDDLLRAGDHWEVS